MNGSHSVRQDKLQFFCFVLLTLLSWYLIGIAVIMDYNERVRGNKPKDWLCNFPCNFPCDFPMYVSRHNVWIARVLSSGGRARFYFHFYNLQPLIIQFKTTIQSGETCRSSRGLGETFKSLCMGRSFQWMTTSFLTNS